MDFRDRIVGEVAGEKEARIPRACAFSQSSVFCLTIRERHPVVGRYPEQRHARREALLGGQRIDADVGNGIPVLAGLDPEPNVNPEFDNACGGLLK